MILVIDNYDSFTYNLVQYLGELGADLEIYRNDQITIGEIEAKAPAGIVLSPGPKTPDEAGITMDVIRNFAGKIPILGVCLGHQAMGQVFGGKVSRAPKIMHGKTSKVLHDGKGVFKGLDNPFDATRYHSLIVERASMPDCLEISANGRRWNRDGDSAQTIRLRGRAVSSRIDFDRSGQKATGKFSERTWQ